jgi:hypothetical protein
MARAAAVLSPAESVVLMPISCSEDVVGKLALRVVNLRRAVQDRQKEQAEDSYHYAPR